MIGQTLGHYRVVEQIGAGGMGLVFRAHDERLDRDVALKVLPPGTLGDENARRRFRKEALTLSKLNHPNIETVFDFDTQDGVDFLVMELILGATLDQKLAAGALPEKEALRLGQQLAEGLAAAHERGVIHRDLKPGNISITSDGRLKILDFGLAKLLHPASETAVTESLSETHGPVGTLPYMAPEQLRGEKADARTDIWAAGAVLYEMATGRRPFDARVSTALAGDIQHKPPPSPQQLNPELSPRVDELILKCLEKEPENRYQSAKELAVDLRRLAAPGPSPTVIQPGKSIWKTVLAAGVALGLALVAVVAILNPGGLRDRLLGRTAPAGIQSIAVLPLSNLSGDPGQEYFADGMTEALISDLAKIRALKVISRTSVMHYKGTSKTVPEIARELGVDAVVEGSVLREGNQVRITVQLIHAATDQHLWAESYQRELRGVLVLQGEVASNIADEIRAQVTPQERQRLASASAKVDPEVYDLYLKGRDAWNRREEEKDVQKALAYYEQAIAKDPTYAPAHASLAEALTSAASRGMLPRAEGYARARVAASRALELDDSLAEAHLALAGVKDEWDYDWQGGEREFKRALEVYPSYANAHCWYSQHLISLGRHAEAIAEARLGERLDPFSYVCGDYVAAAFFYARRYDECIEQQRKLIQAHPDAVGAHFGLSDCYAWKGMFDEAVATFAKGATLGGFRKEDIAGYERAYKTGGWKGQAAYDLEWGKRLGYDPGPGRYIILEKYDQALEQLEKMVTERAFAAVFLKVDPRYDPVRSDPRFQALLKRMNFPP